jgi:hypothetical protein
LSRLPEVDGTRAVLIGVSSFDSLPDLPAVANNIRALARLLRRPSILGLPTAHCNVLTSRATPASVDHAVRAAAESAADTLIVYYAGHGLLDPDDGSLHLAIQKSDERAVRSTSVPYEWVRRAILTGPARRLVILDCCFSARALNTMSGTDLASVAEAEGTAVIAAASKNAKAISPVGERYTAFTAEIIAVLEHGLPEGPQMITLDSLYAVVERALRSKGRPSPHRAYRNTVGELAFRNPAWAPPGEPSLIPAQISSGTGSAERSDSGRGHRGFKILVSFDECDRALFQALAMHLAGCRNPEFDVIEETGHYRSGKTALEMVRIVILLIGPQYLVSSEFPRTALRTAPSPTHVVIPVLARPCDRNSGWLGTLQALPRDGRALSQVADLDGALATIVAEIAAVARRQIGIPADPQSRFSR